MLNSQMSIIIQPRLVYVCLDNLESFCVPFLQHYGSKLESLVLGEIMVNSGVLENINFEKLETLSCTQYTLGYYGNLSDVFQSTKNLKKFIFYYNERKEIHDLATDLIKYHSNLEDLTIDLGFLNDNHYKIAFESALHGLELGLSELKAKKDKFQFQINSYHGFHSKCSADFYVNIISIERVINQLNELCLVSFTLIINGDEWLSSKIGIQRIQHMLRHKTDVELVRNGRNGIVLQRLC